MNSFVKMLLIVSLDITATSVGLTSFMYTFSQPYVENNEYAVVMVYFQMVLTYVAIRLRLDMCACISVPAFFKFHLCFFLFSLFNIMNFYVFLIRGLNDEKFTMFDSPNLITLETISFVLSHGVTLTFLCCPSVIIPRQVEQRERRQRARIE